MMPLQESPPRGDADILREVVDRLERDPRCHDARVGVAVDAAVVTLTGEVPSVAFKHHVEQAVHRVPGVLALASELVAVRPEAHARDDHDLARTVAARLRAETDVPLGELEVTVSGAAVTLEGRVDWPYQRERAGRIVAELPGVGRVDNRIRLVERVRAYDVRCAVAAELQRQAARTAGRVRLEVMDNRVTLEGAVRSAREKDDVERAAWSVSGVLEVRNRLAVDA
jgi:osmotically-inducible protein OsmY